jgi:precorrin-3B methylase
MLEEKAFTFLNDVRYTLGEEKYIKILDKCKPKNNQTEVTQTQMSRQERRALELKTRKDQKNKRK